MSRPIVASEQGALVNRPDCFEYVTVRVGAKAPVIDAHHKVVFAEDMTAVEIPDGWTLIGVRRGYTPPFVVGVA